MRFFALIRALFDFSWELVECLHPPFRLPGKIFRAHQYIWKRNRIGRRL